ncbi:LOW QUALITY PROTEIN: E3 ubiquitin-protein ligase parkin-like [Saccoglossus kowalevskii]|uniref:E3 ubiquitin-protein ligase parkin n=1 Tax=Saccoglossus kowalevskii TaxID=10224 RepID=A0ABM0MGT0_SACKO|nr:PREDICTED: LOW QUALITY PROTEIN: E3 ubiquitin-protein ligase parkin-like [Saccoglossus kowalevskii]
MSTFSLQIQISTGDCLNVDVSDTWTIRKLKTEINKQVKEDTTSAPDPNRSDDHDGAAVWPNLRLVLSGRELHDEFTIQECNLRQHSIIHAIITVKNDKGIEKPSRKSYTSLESSISDHRPHFYVFCKMCADVRLGKLRVCCQQCQAATFIVEQDPTCWDDVLRPMRIHGTCQSDGCHGNTAEFYFKCASHKTSLMERAAVLYLIKTNTQHVSCITCTDTSDPVLIFPCQQSHAICIPCFTSYSSTKLNERQFIQTPQYGYTIGCVAGCENSFIQEIHHFRLMGQQQYEKYHRFATEECLLQSGDVLCPNAGCGEGLSIPDMQIRKIHCKTCKFLFCRHCLLEYHSGECYQQLENPSGGATAGDLIDPVQAERARWEREARETIRKTTKPCPKCKVPVERNSGCMHMACPRPNCNFEWCWICQKEWNLNCTADHWFG